jgi:hypothetical protein
MAMIVVTGGTWLAACECMSSDYPVRIDAISPPRFDRVQLLLRVVIAIVLGWFGFTAGWLACVLFALLPLIAAVAISSRGRDAYLKELAPPLWATLGWLLELSAYMLLLVDRFPVDGGRSIVTEVRYTGQPTTGSALARLVTSLPSGIVLSLLWCVSIVLWVVAALAVLLGVAIPRSIHAFQRGVLRWQGRLVAYHASFVAEYPPWSFDTELPSAGQATLAAHIAPDDCRATPRQS